MIIKSLLTTLGVLAVFCLPHPAQAVDQLPLPNAGVTPVQAEIFEFASADARPAVKDPCSRFLNTTVIPNDEKIRAIKAYRQCRAEYALQELAVWRWQGEMN